jgi:hypothetical protein
VFRRLRSLGSEGEHPIGRMTSAQAEMRGGLTQIMVAAGQRVTIGEFEPDGLRA